MNILILGGTPESITLAESLAKGRHQPIYGHAGSLARSPKAPCAGPFPTIDALTACLLEQGAELLIDASDPYDRTASLKAFEAAEQAGIPLWGYQRLPWRQQDGDRWVQTPDWFITLEISGFSRPLITLGDEARSKLDRIPADQQWFLWVSPGSVPPGPGYQLLERREEPNHDSPGHDAPDRDELLALLSAHQCDVVVTRDLGGPVLSPEVEAARARDLPVIFQARPALPEPRRLFNDINTLLLALSEK